MFKENLPEKDPCLENFGPPGGNFNRRVTAVCHLRSEMHPKSYKFSQKRYPKIYRPLKMYTLKL